MELHGTIICNLEAALASARRFRNQHVYQETLDHWTAVLHRARLSFERGSAANPDKASRLIDELSIELAGRTTA